MLHEQKTTHKERLQLTESRGFHYINGLQCESEQVHLNILDQIQWQEDIHVFVFMLDYFSIC